MMTDMQPGDIGLEISDDDIPYWAKGIPHCEACGRFCLYLEPEGTPPVADRDRLLVCSVPGVPVSVARCPDCVKARVWPYGILVSQAACIVDVTKDSWTSQLAPWFIQMVDHTLEATGRSWRVFLRDVRDDVAAMAAYMEDPSTDGSEREPVVGPGRVLYGDPVGTLPDGSIASAGCPVCDDEPRAFKHYCGRADCPYMGRGES